MDEKRIPLVLPTHRHAPDDMKVHPNAERLSGVRCGTYKTEKEYVVMLGDFVDDFSLSKPFDPADIEKGAKAVMDTQTAIIAAIGPITLDPMAILGPPPGWTGPKVPIQRMGDTTKEGDS